MTPRSDQLAIEVTWRLRQNWLAVPLLTRVAAHVARAEGFRTGALSIAVVGARAMARLHDDYMRDPTPTDVLTFDLGTDAKHGTLEGEIVVCADVARREALTRLRQLDIQHARPRRAIAPPRALTAARHELALYVTHGLLHLAGYDDHDPRAYRKMHAREDELLAQLKVGPVFAPA